MHRDIKHSTQWQRYIDQMEELEWSAGHMGAPWRTYTVSTQESALWSGFCPEQAVEGYVRMRVWHTGLAGPGLQFRAASSLIMAADQTRESGQVLLTAHMVPQWPTAPVVWSRRVEGQQLCEYTHVWVVGKLQLCSNSAETDPVPLDCSEQPAPLHSQSLPTNMYKSTQTHGFSLWLEALTAMNSEGFNRWSQPLQNFPASWDKVKQKML